MPAVAAAATECRLSGKAVARQGIIAGKDHKCFVRLHGDLISYVACRDAIHQMLAQTPLVSEFDLAPDNWDDFLPHDLATLIVGVARRDADEQGGVALRYNVHVDLTIWVKIVYSEHKALLLACNQRAALTRCLFAATPTDCCVCMEDFAAAIDGDTTVRLPCSHAFHRACILPWFYKASTCPKCRHGLSMRKEAGYCLLVAAYDSQAAY
ncbi:hypothetical protein CFC21_053983 [Triticum aestivum]|uniref:RING-type domain-containing protein n=2 Tax=Triticum aestivum TaxID=4565 RepID=A0A3B6HY10_WHEAT|nr:hypothetical protein CFC21_053983 [Triticum aestivum]